MKTTMLATMTAVALMAFGPAFAAGERGQTETMRDRATTEMERATGMPTGPAEETRKEPGVGQQAQEPSAMESETIHALQFREGAAPENQQTVKISSRTTTDEILGKEIQNDRGNEVASLDDIIIDSGGNIEKIVLSQGGFLGLGAEKVALDYDQVMNRDWQQGDMLGTVSEATLRQAPLFSTTETRDPNAYVMPATSISLRKIINTEALDPEGEKIASAENIQLKDGKAKHVILDLEDSDQKVAIEFSQLQLVREDDSYHFALTGSQAMQLSRIAAAGESGMEMERDMWGTDAEEY